MRGKAQSKKLKRILETGADRIETDRLDDLVADTKSSSEMREAEKYRGRRARDRRHELEYLKETAAEKDLRVRDGAHGHGRRRHEVDAEGLEAGRARDEDTMARLDRLEGSHAKGVDKIRRLDEELGKDHSGDAKQDLDIKAELHREKRKEKVKLVKALLDDLKTDSAAHRPLAARTDIDDDEDLRGVHGGFETESELDAQVAKAKLLKGKREKAAAAA